MAGKMLEVTDSSFDAIILKSSVPALVDFWAAWCAPCKAIAPLVEEISEEYAGKIKITKMNVDENPSTSANTECAAYRPSYSSKTGRWLIRS